MKQETPGAGRTAHRGEEIGKPDPTNLVPRYQDSNTSGLARQKAWQNLGYGWCRHGELNACFGATPNTSLQFSPTPARPAGAASNVGRPRWGHQ